MHDPEQLALACIPLVRYAERHAIFKRAKKAELSRWRNDPMMKTVERIAHELAEEELANAESC